MLCLKSHCIYQKGSDQSIRSDRIHSWWYRKWNVCVLFTSHFSNASSYQRTCVNGASERRITRNREIMILAWNPGLELVFYSSSIIISFHGIEQVTRPWCGILTCVTICLDKIKVLKSQNTKCNPNIQCALFKNEQTRINHKIRRFAWWRHLTITSRIL